ncbi:MAG: rhodanese-like domain-containing protein [Verrucomicrobiae bacterium]|nr:rhodanese-like domain-containing protein [Verrucomicrobiae bacterium]
MTLWKQISLILGCAAAAGVVSAFVHPLRPPWKEVEDPAKARWHIDVAGAKALASEKVVWVDARKRDSYEQGHVEGALLLNQEEWGELMFEHQSALQEAFQHPVIVYCDGNQCERSEEVAERLRELLGLDPVYVLKGDWREIAAAR